MGGWVRAHQSWGRGSRPCHGSTGTLHLRSSHHAPVRIVAGGRELRLQQFQLPPPQSPASRIGQAGRTGYGSIAAASFETNFRCRGTYRLQVRPHAQEPVERSVKWCNRQKAYGEGSCVKWCNRQKAYGEGSITVRDEAA
jgi:hypothetical protein